jgi:hypothetical protein
MQILQQHSSLDGFSYKQQEKETSKTSLGWTIPCFQLFIAPVLLCSLCSLVLLGIQKGKSTPLSQ